MEKKHELHSSHIPQHEPAHIKHVHHKSESKTGLLDKLFIAVILISIVYLAYLFYQDEILALLKMNPYVWSVISHIAGEISQKTILGLFYISFFGALFFVFLPQEAVFLYYLTLGYSLPFLVILAVIGYMMGMSINYIFGFAFGTRLVKMIVGDKFEKFHKLVTKWGAAVLLFGNMLLFPIQPVSVVVGAARYSFKKFFIFSTIGITAKLLLLATLNAYFGDAIRGFIQNSI